MPYPTAFGKSQTLMEPQYHEAFHAWKNRQDDVELTNHMLTTVQPAVDKAVALNVGSQADPIIKGQAKLLALQAMKSYDPTKASIATHLTRNLQRLKRVSVRRNQPIPIPERWLASRKSVQNSEDELTDKLGRPPTMDELAGHTQMSIPKLRKLKGTLFPTSEGATSQTGDTYLPVQLPGSHPGSQAFMEMVYGDMDDINKKIMEWTLGIHGQPALSNSQIAQKLKLTPGAISQRKSSIQSVLDQESALSPF